MRPALAGGGAKTPCSSAVWMLRVASFAPSLIVGIEDAGVASVEYEDAGRGPSACSDEGSSLGSSTCGCRAGEDLGMYVGDVALAESGLRGAGLRSTFILRGVDGIGSGGMV